MVSFGAACLCASGCVAAADSGVAGIAPVLSGAESASLRCAGFCGSACDPSLSWTGSFLLWGYWGIGPLSAQLGWTLPVWASGL